MSPVYFSICCVIVTHPNQWAVIELRIEKGVHENASFRQTIYEATLDRVYIFGRALLQMSVIWFSNVNLVSNLTPNSFMHSLFLTSYSSTLLLAFSLKLINR